jgi:hypothetical protein
MADPGPAGVWGAGRRFAEAPTGAVPPPIMREEALCVEGLGESDSLHSPPHKSRPDWEKRQRARTGIQRRTGDTTCSAKGVPNWCGFRRKPIHYTNLVSFWLRKKIAL